MPSARFSEPVVIERNMAAGAVKKIQTATGDSQADMSDVTLVTR